jgi:hypothetical protein
MPMNEKFQSEKNNGDTKQDFGKCPTKALQI